MRTTPAIVLRSAFFLLGQSVSAGFFGTLGLLLFPFPYRTRYAFITLWTDFNLWFLKTVCAIDYVVQGRENIPSIPTVVLCKHQSAWETLALQKLFRPQVWVLKRELLRLPFIGWGLAMLEPIAIDRKARIRSIEQVVRQGKDRLAKGRWVVIFPEGTRVAPGETKRYLPGGAKLAVEAGCAVVPVAHNAGSFWPRNGFLKFPGTIRMVVGKPIESEGLKTNQLNRLVEDWIETTARSLERSAGEKTGDAASVGD